MAVHETVDMKHGHETVTDSISTYQFQGLDPAVVYILSLECLIAIYCGGQPSLGGGGGGLGFVRNVMGLNLGTTEWPWAGGQTFSVGLTGTEC